LGGDSVPQRYSDLLTLLPFCSVTTKWETTGEAHLSYYASAYNSMEINQPPLDLFISSM